MKYDEWETLPTLEEKHDVSNRTLTTLKKVMFAQDDYGIEKYNVPLKHEYKYDWLKMLMEELADGLKYLQNEIDRKELVIKMLEYALTSTAPRDYIQYALELLKMDGTGK